MASEAVSRQHVGRGKSGDGRRPRNEVQVGKYSWGFSAVHLLSLKKTKPLVVSCLPSTGVVLSAPETSSRPREGRPDPSHVVLLC